VMTVERGVDPRTHVLVAFGGAGPLHACAVAEALEIRTVLIPAAAGVLSALGLVISERRIELVESAVVAGPALSGEAVAEIVERLSARGRAELGSPHAERRCGFDLRYAGQAFELTIRGDSNPEPASLAEAFERAHRDRFGFDDPGAAVELVSVRVAVFEPNPEPPAHASSFAAPSGSRPVRFASGVAETTIYAGVPQSAVGPALCELDETTVLVPPGWSATGEAGSIRLEASG
ncbi:MAG: hydantoinase/oxoprolinase family protein, partial [Thermoleophilaceae bacterium]|nr:hydantoinase/oxoprolinase family protein [Thermoleophilaceae bacterium]